MSSAQKHYRHGEIMPAAHCRYCHGSGSVKVIKGSAFGLPRLVSTPCAHRAGDPFSEQRRSSRLSRLISIIFSRRGRS
ncbi:MAG TPA: hypothetical protein VNS79_03745 [Sphingobium sp.]|nr:hypothetical protein [Sphingobium sp.]